MKALIKYAPGEGNLAIRDVEEPRCGDNQVKIAVAFCGICGTDLHVMHDTFPNYPPVILGHELAGTVAETGRHVEGLTTGDAVSILGASSVTCGRCAYCRSGNFMFCSVRRGMGHGVNGGFAPYVVARPDQVYRIPAGVSLEEAALSEPFSVAVHAVVELTPARPGDTVLISGPGPVGLLCLKLLAAQGIKTIVAGTPGDGVRLEAARRMGAAVVVNIGERNLVEAVRAETAAGGADIAFECAGHADSVRGCLQSLRPMGRYTQVAICAGDIPFPMNTIVFKQLSMAGSLCYTEQTWARTMRIFAAGNVRLGDLISTSLPLSAWRTGFDLCLERKGLKVLLYPEA